MKFSIPPAGSVSPCVRMFIESLLSEVEDASFAGLFEPERLESIRPKLTEIERGKFVPRLRAS